MNVEIPLPSRFKIEDLFRENNFIVPVYQRNYAWGRSEVGDFWEDLKDLVNGKRRTHFFGQIVTYKSNSGVQEIIDGQQRLTTCTIFMAAVRDIANEIYQDNFRSPKAGVSLESGDLLRDIRLQVERSLYGEDKESVSMIVEPELDGDKNRQLQSYFFKLISGNQEVITGKAVTEPTKNMQTAYKKMYDGIKQMIRSKVTLGDRVDLLRKIFDAFFHRFYLVMISAPSREDAFTIFETLNSRGKDLEASDIIKNHLMSMMGNSIGQSSQDWENITNYLNNDSRHITKFIRTYWASKERVVSAAKLYRGVSSNIVDMDSAHEFLNDLKKLIELYTVLESPLKDENTSKFFLNKQITDRIDTFSRMGVVLYYPVVMAMYYRDYREADILKVVNKLVAVFIRHRTIINDGTNKLETGFSEIARNIWNLNYLYVDDVINAINQKLLKSSEAAVAAFSVLSKEGAQRGAKKWTLVYLLSELYKLHLEDLSEDDFHQSIFDDDNYRLRQVSLSGDVHEYRNYIGNWVLLEKELAKTDFSNLDDAVLKLSKSRLLSNRNLAQRIKQSGWGVEKIKKRQEDFGRDAMMIW